MHGFLPSLIDTFTGVRPCPSTLLVSLDLSIGDQSAMESAQPVKENGTISLEELPNEIKL
jgi:hypothetical protein